MKNKKPLYRKVNRRPQYLRSYLKRGSEAKYERNTKKGLKRSMKRKDIIKIQDYDYTPLFQFLLKQVGREWNEVFSEIKQRLNSEDAIWYMVDKGHVHERNYNTKYFQYGEGTIFSRLKISEEGILKFVDPNYRLAEFKNDMTEWTKTDPVCYSFNGKKINK